MATIRWLHISDLHLNKQGVENERLREKLITYLKNQSLHCDYVFCTGDLRYAPRGEYAENTVELLTHICDSVGAPIENMFIVPGNHDVDRDIPERTAAIESIWPKDCNGYYPNQYNANIGTIEPEKLDDILKGEESYRRIILPFSDAQATAFNGHIHQFGPHTLYETANLNIVTLDSTLVYTKENDTNLIVGTYDLKRMLEKRNPLNPTIVLTHYSFDYLNREEQTMVSVLFHDYNVRLWLAGHEHNNLMRMQRDYFYEFQCGNLLLENGAQTCILIGGLDTETLAGSVNVHAWFSPNGWAPYPFACFDAEDPSTYRFSLNGSLPTNSNERERRQLKEKITPLLMSNQDLFNQYGPTNKNRYNLQSELAEVWEDVLQNQIIPNSYRILTILDKHRELLTTQEEAIVRQYRLHVDGLRMNHSGRPHFIYDAPRFPVEIFKILS